MSKLIPYVRDEDPVILMREGKLGRTSWRQYMVVTNERVAVVHMKPALFAGWNIERVEIQDGEDWKGQTRDQIVAWKLANDDGLTHRAGLDDLNPPEFRARLLETRTRDGVNAINQRAKELGR